MKMSLIKTAICDDIHKELETIRAALDTYAEAHSELYFDIDEYGAAIDVLHVVEKGKVYDIDLLNICMPGVLGTDVAEEMIAKIFIPRRSSEEVQKTYMDFCRKGALK